jgi:hypothetical protein
MKTGFMDTLHSVLLRDTNNSSLYPPVIPFTKKIFSSSVKLFLYLIKLHGMTTRGLVVRFTHF